VKTTEKGVNGLRVSEIEFTKHTHEQK